MSRSLGEQALIGTLTGHGPPVDKFLLFDLDGTLLTLDGRPTDGDLTSIVPGPCAEALLEAVRGVLASEAPWSGTLAADGASIEVRAAPAGGGRALVVLTERPISSPGDWYRRIIETTREGVWVIDTEAKTAFVSPRMAEMLGYTVEEMIGRSLFDFMDDEGRRIAERNIERRRSGIAEEHLFRLRRADGSALWTRMDSTPIAGPDGAYAGALAMVADITHRRRVEDERTRLWSILDRSLNEIYIFHPQTLRFEYANAGALNNLGFTLPEILERTPLDLKTSIDEPTFRALIAPVTSGEQQKLVFTTEHRRADGTTYPVEVHLQLVAHEQTRVLVAFVNDITERKRAEDALRASEDRFRSLIETSLDLIFLFDRRRRIVFASPSVADLGYRPEALLQRELMELVHPEDSDALCAAFDQLERGEIEIGRMVFRIRSREGAWRTLEAHARDLRHLPAVGAILAAARDVTEQRRLEAQYLQAKKLEGLGRLAGGIAHDFNNILTAILSYAELLEVDGGANVEDVREIRRAGERARDLTGQLLAFARKQVISPRPVDLDRLVHDTERMLRRLLGEDIDLVTELSGEGVSVEVDPSQIEQVVLNLVVNARDAMPTGGRVTLTTATVALGSGDSALQTDMSPGDYVVLEVRDTGIGISPEDLPHVFEPFYSTKAVGQGTGLGLATVYGIVRQARGQIRVDSRPGEGAAFRLYFPKIDVPARHETEPATPEPAPQAGTVLVVEDDVTVRELCVRALRTQGYRVLAAGHPEQALDLVSIGPSPDLLLTDVVMPGMSGRSLADRLCGKIPGLRVLYMSGYTEDAIHQRGVLDPGIELLVKPFTPSMLRERVWRALGQ